MRMQQIVVILATLVVLGDGHRVSAASGSAMPTPVRSGSKSRTGTARVSDTPTKAVAKATPTASSASRSTSKEIPSASTKASRKAIVVVTPNRITTRENQPVAERSGVTLSTAGFNTDYRTRSAAVEAPFALQGAGLRGRNIPIGYEDAYRKSLPADYAPTDLVLLPKEIRYCGQAVYLRQEAAESAVRMFNDAARQGLTLQVVSAFRDIAHQRRLFASSGGGNVAKPGHSEHMLGTTMDVTNSSKYLFKRSFVDTAEGRWLCQNAWRYGWKATVMSSSGRRGHNDEPWHLRYFGSTLSGGTTHIASAPEPPAVRQPVGLFSSFRKSLGKVTSVLPLRRHLESEPPNYYTSDPGTAPAGR